MFMYVSPEAFGLACEFMGSPVVKAIVPILALGFVFHIVYAFVLNARNLRARGHAKYEGGNNTPVSFAAKNMLVLGIIVLAGLAFHLTQFWAQMQLQQFIGGEEYSLVGEYGLPVLNAEGELVAPYMLAKIYFSNIIFDVIYIIWIAALWFHLSHGFWSAFQTLGINNRKWFYRWNVIGQIFATIVCLGFISFPISFLLGILG
jgi:succinate dehydrogenase / fumarate reductase cytochrome b subunit